MGEVVSDLPIWIPGVWSLEFIWTLVFGIWIFRRRILQIFDFRRMDFGALKASSRRGVAPILPSWALGIWSLEFIWILDFGIWIFRQ
jgi:hypothetical protein